MRLAAWRLPAPLHLAGALAGASGLSWRERLALIRDYRALAARGFRCAADATVATLFAATPPRAFAALWEPLTLAALNTPPERASAQLFANVLAAAFAGARRDSDFLVPAVDLSALLPDAAVADVVARGGRVPHRDDGRAHRARRRRRRNPCAPRARRTGSTRSCSPPGRTRSPRRSATATSAHPAVDALRRMVAAFAYESITTVWLGFAADVAWPGRVVRLDDAPGQWLFDRRDALTAVDAAPRHRDRDREPARGAAGGAARARRGRHQRRRSARRAAAGRARRRGRRPAAATRAGAAAVRRGTA